MNFKNNSNIDIIKLFEDFNKKETPDEIIFMSYKIRKDLEKEIFNSKSYSFGSYKFKIIINFLQNKDINYGSEIDILDILVNLYDDDYVVNIPINIKDEKVNINKLIGIISHELRHLYDILNINEIEIKDFMKKRNFNSFIKDDYYKFIFQIYLTLEHELIARNNMIYTSLRWSGMKNKKELINNYKTMYTYSSLIDLKNFNYLDFVKSFDENFLIEKTNKFIKEIANSNEYCNDMKDLLYFYKKWDIFFENKANEYLNHALKEIDKVYDDIIKNKIYESKFLFSHDGYNINIIEKFFDKWYKEMFRKE